MSHNNHLTENIHYMTHERLLIELHRLIAEGKGDKEEAEAVRDEMDGAEQNLSQPEIMRSNGLSADLYMLQDKEIYEPYAGTQVDLRLALSEALVGFDYEAVLSLLRKDPRFLTPAQVAALRGRCYAALGHLETGLLFMRYAAKREPEQAAHSLYILMLLVRLNRGQEVFSELAQLSRSQEATPEADPYVRSLTGPLLLAA